MHFKTHHFKESTETQEASKRKPVHLPETYTNVPPVAPCRKDRPVYQSLVDQTKQTMPHTSSHRKGIHVCLSYL